MFCRNGSDEGDHARETAGRDLVAGRGYDALADEYYDDRHVTSRNFDEATASYFDDRDRWLPREGLILELGAGRGRTREYCGVDESRVVHVDSSRRMLHHAPREDARARIQADALALPVATGDAAAVTAFLYDPFNRPGLYAEIGRVLEPGGWFVGTLPHHRWGATLRGELGTDPDRATFVRRDGSEVTVPSFLMTRAELETALSQAGLRPVEWRDLSLPPGTERISEHVEIAAAARGTDVSKLPVVKVVLAKK